MTPEQLLTLIAQGDTARVIKVLLASTRASNPRLHEEVIQLSAQYQSFRREARAGMLSSEEKDARLSQIHGALIELAHELPQGASLLAGNKASATPLTARKWWWPVLALVMVIIVIAAYWGFQTTNTLAESSDKPPTITKDESPAVTNRTESSSSTQNDKQEKDTPEVSNADQSPASKPPIVVPTPSPPMTYDTLELRLNSGVSVLIDDKKPDFVFETISIKRIRVPSTARKISLVIDGKKYTRPLQSLPSGPIYQRNFIQYFQ